MFTYVIGALSIIWAIVVFFFTGEKYMKWYYRNTGKNYQDFDSRKFRLAHAGSLAVLGILFLIIPITGWDWVKIFLCAAPVIVNYLLILTWCKKK